jgi:hypothetical protein
MRRVGPQLLLIRKDMERVGHPDPLIVGPASRCSSSARPARHLFVDPDPSEEPETPEVTGGGAFTRASTPTVRVEQIRLVR